MVIIISHFTGHGKYYYNTHTCIVCFFFRLGPRRLDQHCYTVFGSRTHRYAAAWMLLCGSMCNGGDIRQTVGGQRPRTISIPGTPNCQDSKRRRNSIYRVQGCRRASSCHKLVKIIMERKNRSPSRSREIFNLKIKLSPEPSTIDYVDLN